MVRQQEEPPVAPHKGFFPLGREAPNPATPLPETRKTVRPGLPCVMPRHHSRGHEELREAATALVAHRADDESALRHQATALDHPHHLNVRSLPLSLMRWLGFKAACKF